METEKKILQKLNLLAYTRVFSCLGLLPAKLDAAGGLRLSALSLWLGRAFVAYSSEYITKAKPLGLHARVQLPGAAAGQARRGRRAAAQRTLAVARRAFVAYSSEYITKLNLLVYMRVQLPGAAAGQPRRGRRAAAQRALAVARPRVRRVQ
ncbi:hypothetical protein EVAR_42717_1 [Eumeta japonica]|uniref:Uncharacterized protein n=1 Tax=Eumeta variegata TaxID=151549 RepID=A0A4C1XIA5_EUMVA|nr:hypothetical protein EVAR_42717_1 [Eumeta japonica]